MQPLILTPAQALWRPRAAGRVVLAKSIVPPRWLRLPQSPDGLLFASGDTLQILNARAADFPATNYATFNTRNNHLVLQFDTTTQETVYFHGTMPVNYAGGNLVVRVKWSAATATSGTIGWGVTFERIASGGDDMDADSFATEQLISSTTVPASSGVVTMTSVTCVAGATGTDSVAAGDDFRIRIRRDVANDTAAGDAELWSVEIREA
jgi:hypothetical protein